MRRLDAATNNGSVLVKAIAAEVVGGGIGS
jgi:hypothetical protein